LELYKICCTYHFHIIKLDLKLFIHFVAKYGFASYVESVKKKKMASLFTTITHSMPNDCGSRKAPTK